MSSWGSYACNTLSVYNLQKTNMWNNTLFDNDKRGKNMYDAYGMQ